MATKFRISQDPTFETNVDIPRVGGTIITVPFTFKYRDRLELAELFASWQVALKADQAALNEKGDDVTLIDVTETQVNRQVEQVTALVIGWGFDDKVSPESIRRLVETSSGAGDAIVAAYQAAYSPARQKN